MLPRSGVQPHRSDAEHTGEIPTNLPRHVVSDDEDGNGDVGYGVLDALRAEVIDELLVGAILVYTQ